MATNKKTKTKKSQAVKYVLIGLGGTALLTAGYFGWKYFSSPKSSSENYPETEPNPTPSFQPTPKPQSKSAPVRNDNFPLKRGSRGAKVIALQQALIAKYGVAILPKYGVDGDFGLEVETALKSKGLPTILDAVTFNSITQSVYIPPVTSDTPQTIAKEVYETLIGRNLERTLQVLRKIKDKAHYSAVSQVFKTTYRINLVHQTLVNATLTVFNGESSKDKIRAEFSRMGLIERNGKWSLEGVAGRQLITIKPTRILRDNKTFVDVPANLILGTEIRRKGLYSAFKNDGKFYLVKTKAVAYTD